MNHIHTLFPLGLLCCAAIAQAGSPRDVRDGETMEAAIAHDAPTRIRLLGQRITSFVGNIHSTSNCEALPAAGAAAQPVAPLTAPALNPRGEVIVNCDLDKGEIYVRPASPIPSKPISLFISSPRATYTLLLRPAQMAAETLNLRDRHQEALSGTSQTPRLQAGGHVKALKAMLVAMAAGRETQGVQVESMDVAQALWEEADFRLIRTHRDNALLGETYRLRNTGTATMVLAEQELDREGALAVAIEQHNLRPGDATLVYVIRRQEAP